MTERNKAFSNERIELHGGSFHHCTFENCELVFDGIRDRTLHGHEISTVAPHTVDHSFD